MKQLEKNQPFTGNSRDAHRAIGTGLAWVFGFLVLAKGVGAAKEMALAARFGVGAVMDAYVLVHSIVMWPVAVMLSVLTVVVVPVDARLGAGDPAGARRFRGELLGWCIAGSALLSLLLLMALPALLPALGLRGDSLLAGERMVPGLAACAGLAGVTTLYSSWIMARGQHANTALEAVPALVLLMILLMADSAGTQLLVLGTLAGASAHLVVAAWFSARLEAPVRPALRAGQVLRSLLAGAFGLTLLGQAAYSTGALLEQVIAAHLGEGAVSTLGYANRVLALLLGIGAVAVHRASLPVLSRLAADMPDRGVGIAMRWVVWMFGIGLILAGALALGAIAFVELLFQRGQFGARETAEVAAALRAGSIQLPPYLAALVLTSYAAAAGRFRLLFAATMVGVLARVLAALVAAPTAGVPGLAASPTVAHLLTLFVLVWGVWRTAPTR